MSLGDSDGEIAAVRAFNRAYTKKLGVLDQHLLKSPYSLSEARVMYELAHRDEMTATEIGGELGLDPGYLSRIVQGFEDDGLISREALASDRRHFRLALTTKGRQAFARLDRSSHDEVAAMLSELTVADRKRLTEAMETIERLLGLSRAVPSRPAILRDPRPGDMGYVVQSHGALYAGEYGFDATFEALVAEIVAKFITSFDAARERCWIADIDGDAVGSVFLVRHSDDVAKLRLAAGRSRRPRAGHRPATGRRMHQLRPRLRLPQDHAMDPEYFARRPQDLPGRRFQARGERTAPQLWPGPDRGDLGTRAVIFAALLRATAAKAIRGFFGFEVCV